MASSWYIVIDGQARHPLSPRHQTVAALLQLTRRTLIHGGNILRLIHKGVTMDETAPLGIYSPNFYVIVGRAIPPLEPPLERLTEADAITTHREEATLLREQELREQLDIVAREDATLLREQVKELREKLDTVEKELSSGQEKLEAERQKLAAERVENLYFTDHGGVALFGLPQRVPDENGVPLVLAKISGFKAGTDAEKKSIAEHTSLHQSIASDSPRTIEVVMCVNIEHGAKSTIQAALGPRIVELRDATGTTIPKPNADELKDAPIRKKSVRTASLHWNNTKPVMTRIPIPQSARVFVLTQKSLSGRLIAESPVSVF